MEIVGPHTEDEAARFRLALQRNTTLLEVLRRAATMDLSGWYLAAGAITQTVWNMVTNQPAETGIDDYDLVYFDDSDLSWEAEDKVIQAGDKVFGSLPVRVEIRNQARVHLWYADRFGIPGCRHMSTEGAIASWLSGTALIGVCVHSTRLTSSVDQAVIFVLHNAIPSLSSTSFDLLTMIHYLDAFFLMGIGKYSLHGGLQISLAWLFGQIQPVGIGRFMRRKLRGGKQSGLD